MRAGVVRKFLRLRCLAVWFSGYLRSKAVGFWWVGALDDHDRILGYAWVSTTSHYCCFGTFSAHAQSAHTRPTCANPRARWSATSHVPTVPKQRLLRIEPDQDTAVSWCFSLFSDSHFPLPQPGHRLHSTTTQLRIPNGGHERLWCVL